MCDPEGMRFEFPLTIPIIDRVVGILGIDPASFKPMLMAKSPSQAVLIWEGLLPYFRRVWKRRVFASHPDRGGSLEAFRAVQAAWQVVQSPQFPKSFWRLVREDEVLHLKVSYLHTLLSPAEGWAIYRHTPYPIVSISEGPPGTGSGYPSVLEKDEDPPFTRKW